METSARVTRRLFTVEEYHEMGRAGILTEDDRVELIEGEIVRMSPIGSRHAACVARIANILVLRLKGRAIVWIQNPIDIDERSEPEPDIAILRPDPDFYAAAHPKPEDVLLVIEVADTTLDFDRGVKMPLYARAGIREAWLVDLAGDAIEVHRAPSSGKYADIARVTRGRTLAVLDVDLRAEEVLG